jgi:hypothetical protein
MQSGPLHRLFLEHPRTLGESYWEHARTAARFGAEMVTGGLACLVHAAVPVLFAKTASERVKKLYAQMRSRQPNLAGRRADHEDSAWLPEYEI